MQTGLANIVTKEQATFTELLDNQEGIILDLENLHYYTLNSTAVFLWKQLRSGVALTISALTSALGSAFKITDDVAELDTRTFLDELESNGLILYSEQEGGAYSRALAHVSGDLPAYEPPQLQLSNSLTQVALSGSSTAATAAISTGGI